MEPEKNTWAWIVGGLITLALGLVAAVQHVVKNYKIGADLNGDKAKLERAVADIADIQKTLTSINTRLSHIEGQSGIDAR